MLRLAVSFVLAVCSAGTALAAEADLEPLIQTIRAVGTHGKGHREAAAAWKALSQANAEQLPRVLGGIQEDDLLAMNWLRSAAETIADRRLKAGGKLPIEALEAFLHDRQQAPRARRLAYELIAKVDRDAESRLIPLLADDPSVELRRDAITLLLKQAAAIDATANKDMAIAAYSNAFKSARDLDQIKQAGDKLKELGAPPDLPRHFGFIMQWKLIGPFDNSNKKGFDVAYPPENEVDLSASYEGKEAQKVSWIEHTTTDEHGLVDINKAVGKHMGAIAYAFAEFNSDADRDIELRLGCINGNKMWLNGELLSSNHVYHTGLQIDQYIGRGRLKAGKNQILVKIAQNEQKEDWAQNWMFQLRVCDSVGTALLSKS